MPISYQLAFTRQLLERIAFEAGVVALQIAKDGRLEDKKPSVNPAFADLWFFSELGHEIAIKDQAAKTRWRPNCGGWFANTATVGHLPKRSAP